MLDTRFITEIRLTIDSKSIFRIGNDENDILIDDYTGLPIIPASTFAGLFRSFLTENHNSSGIVDEMFGSCKDEGRKSRIFFYDAYAKRYEKNKNYEHRTRTSIDAEKGVAKNPINTAYLSEHMSFEVGIRIESNSADKEEKYRELICYCINALHHGYLRIGADKTNGAGLFAVADAKYAIYDTHDKNQLRDYLLRKEAEKELNFSTYDIKNKFSVIEAKDVSIESPLLIKGNGKKTGDSDDISIKNIGGKYIIPGSSIKGIIRNRCGQIAEYLGIGDDIIVDMFGSNHESSHAGTITFADAYVEEVKEKKYSGIHIDKLTGGVIKSGLYNRKPITGRTGIKVIYSNSYNTENKDVKMAILLLALRDFFTGKISIGSGFADGFGRVSAESLFIQDFDKEFCLSFDQHIDEADVYLEALRAYIGGVDEKDN